MAEPGFRPSWSDTKASALSLSAHSLSVRVPAQALCAPTLCRTLQGWGRRCRQPPGCLRSAEPQNPKGLLDTGLVHPSAQPLGTLQSQESRRASASLLYVPSPEYCDLQKDDTPILSAVSKLNTQSRYAGHRDRQAGAWTVCYLVTWPGS